MPNKELLLKKLARQQNSFLIFKHITGTYNLTVPSFQLENRGYLTKSHTPDELRLIKISINRAIDKFLTGCKCKGNDEDENQKNVNFAQDVILLWHMHDPRVEQTDKGVLKF
jgi:hypothetical protein